VTQNWARFLLKTLDYCQLSEMDCEPLVAIAAAWTDQVQWRGSYSLSLSEEELWDSYIDRSWRKIIRRRPNPMSGRDGGLRWHGLLRAACRGGSHLLARWPGKERVPGVFASASTLLISPVHFLADESGEFSFVRASHNIFLICPPLAPLRARNAALLR